MRRREVIAGLLLVCTVRRASAQLKVYRIGVVSPSRQVRDLPGDRSYHAFFQRLREHGYVEGQNLAVERYSAEGRTERFVDIVGEAVRSAPDLIYAEGDRLVREFKAATNTIPVVAIMADPIALGIAPNLAQPGGNITGVSVDPGTEFWGKHFELLRQMVPSLSRVAWLATARLWEESPSATTIRTMRRAARSLNVSLIGPPLEAPLDEAEYRRVIAAMVREGADGLIVSAQGENVANERLIVDLAAEAKLPAIYPYPEFAPLGGLIAYGVDLADLLSHAADQVDEILKGAKPSDIPLYQPTKFPLIINLKTAKALGIAMPQTLLIAADEVIE